jgi:hypothetical protein
MKYFITLIFIIFILFIGSIIVFYQSIIMFSFNKAIFIITFLVALIMLIASIYFTKILIKLLKNQNKYGLIKNNETQVNVTTNKTIDYDQIKPVIDLYDEKNKTKIKFLREKLLPEETINFFCSKLSPYSFQLEQGDSIVNGCLCTLHQLHLSTVSLYTWEYNHNEHGRACGFDPNFKKNGEYSIPVIELIAELDEYRPKGIFVWFPDIKQFGTCDIDHGVIYIFKNKKWIDIINNLEDLLNYQWYPWGEDSICDIYEICNPWELWKYIE